MVNNSIYSSLPISTLNIHLLASVVNPLAQFWIVLKQISDTFHIQTSIILHHTTSVYIVSMIEHGDWLQHARDFPQTWRQTVSLTGNGSLKNKKKITSSHFKLMLLKITNSPASPLSLLYFSPLPYCYLTYYIFYLFIVLPTGTWTPWRQVFCLFLFHAVSTLCKQHRHSEAFSNFFLNKWIHPSQRKDWIHTVNFMVRSYLFVI